MLRRNLLSIIAVAALFVSFDASSNENLYKFSFEVSSNGKIVASPVVLVREGEPGNIEVSGPNGCKLTFTATDAGDEKIKIAGTFSSGRGSSTPVVTVKDGQSGSLSDGHFELKFLASKQSS